MFQKCTVFRMAHHANLKRFRMAHVSEWHAKRVNLRVTLPVLHYFYMCTKCPYKVKVPIRHNFSWRDGLHRVCQTGCFLNTFASGDLNFVPTSISLCMHLYKDSTEQIISYQTSNKCPHKDTTFRAFIGTHFWNTHSHTFVNSGHLEKKFYCSLT